MRKVHGVVSLIILLSVHLSGCLDGGSNEEPGISAFKYHSSVKMRAQQTDRTLILVVVTAEEPRRDGSASVWKFAYNDITSGIPLSSMTFEVDIEGTIIEDAGEPLSKQPIRNWTIDSTSAINRAKEEMKEREMINDANVVEVDYLYLLGDSPENGGCQWNIGTRPYEGDTAEVQIVVDGRSGEILSLSKTKF